MGDGLATGEQCGIGVYGMTELSSVSIQRLSLAFGLPEAETIDHIIKMLPTLVESSRVCFVCRDNTQCPSCAFRLKYAPAATLALFAGL
jgi:hypothetical protein